MDGSRICKTVLIAWVVGIMMIGICGGETVSEAAKIVKRPDGAPRYSDVSMRLFVKKKDQAELKAAKAFHITRADWCYINDPEYIKMVHELGWSFQGSLNAVTHNPEFAKKNKDGTPMLDHFGKPGRYWADNENKEYQKWYLEQMVKWIEAGADSLQRDEPTTCRRTPIPEAAKFFKYIHPIFEKEIGRHITISCNLAWNGSMFGGKGEPVAMLFDYGMVEMTRDKVRPDFFWNACKDARERGKALVYTSWQNLGVDNYRLAIAGCYANGMLFMVPWDQFGGINKPRVFSRPEDMADLYGFVQANARYLDGYEDAAAVGYKLKDSRWENNPVLKMEQGDKVSCFVRARPGEEDAEVVVHLIEWGEGQAFKIKLRNDAFFRGGKIFTALLRPIPYEAEMHEKAEKSKDYSSLSRKTDLQTTEKDGWTIVEIPRLEPWGILIVSAK